MPTVIAHEKLGRRTLSVAYHACDGAQQAHAKRAELQAAWVARYPRYTVARKRLDDGRRADVLGVQGRNRTLILEVQF